ncbi:MAG TPA: AAA family ATPase, partial [Byssovorax sp.]
MTAPTNIGEAAASLVGREAALADLVAETRAHRLVTVLGPAGVGKTRLAEEVGRRELARYQGGVWIVDLTTAASALDLCGAVAAALDVPLLADDSALKAARQVALALEARGPALVVLDNLEQLLPEAAPIVGALVAGARGVRFLVTSRRAARVPGEALFELAPLSFGDSASPAVALFLERATAEVRGFSPSDAERSDVDEIVARLDGLPFAIELAAARLRVLGTGELAAKLREGFDVLGAAPRTGRGDTLEGAIAASWELLAATEATALAELSVCRGGFTLDAAADVLTLAPGKKGRPEAALVIVQALVDHSLVHSTAYAGGGRRFKILESVRAFAGRRLADAAATKATEARHAAHFLERARGDVKWLEVESENLFAVAGRALADPNPAAAGR